MWYIGDLWITNTYIRSEGFLIRIASKQESYSKFGNKIGKIFISRFIHYLFSSPGECPGFYRVSYCWPPRFIVHFYLGLSIHVFILPYSFSRGIRSRFTLWSPVFPPRLSRFCSNVEPSSWFPWHIFSFFWWNLHGVFFGRGVEGMGVAFISHLRYRHQ